MVAAQLTHHPVVTCVEQLSAVLSEVGDYEPLYLDTDAKKTVLLGIAEAERRLAGLKLKTMAAAADVAEDDGARDIAAWTAAHTRAEIRPLRQQQKLARAIDDQWQRVGAGMTAGTVSLEQALVIVRGLEALPDHVGLEVIADAEARLVDYARTYNPTELALLADRILFYVAPRDRGGRRSQAPRRGGAAGPRQDHPAHQAPGPRLDPHHHHPPRRLRRPAPDLLRSLHQPPQDQRGDQR